MQKTEAMGFTVLTNSASGGWKLKSFLMKTPTIYGMLRKYEFTHNQAFRLAPDRFAQCI